MIQDIKRLADFLNKTLDGFKSLQWIYKGDIEKVLNNPTAFTLNHVGMDTDAWVDLNRVVIEINQGLHFVFTPINQNVNGLKFTENKWVQIPSENLEII